MRSRDDHTGRMERWAGRKLEALARMGICGCILKKDSPSCGMERVRLYDGKGRVRRTGTGIYAASFLNRFPAMPVEEEGRLRDPGIYDNFVERLFACHRWQEFLVTSPGVADLMSFHARHKLTLASHGDGHYRRLGRLVAGADPRTPKHAIADYGRLLMEALKVRATRKKHANVLYRILGLLKEAADAGDKAELLETIDNYRQGLLPLIVPITLVQHHLRRHPIPWMAEQIYLNPYPAELMLRNSS
jgi:uncharacterized protein YbgA (DUF1722 family)